MSKKLRFLSFILALAMVVSSAPVVPAYAQEEQSPTAEITNPFTSDTPLEINGQTVTSNSYRIPAMVTLADGTIVAAADIRWNTTYDGGGLDTLVARSTDGGKTWSYTAANYLGDNGNQYNGSSSTAFLDPSLTVGADGQTVYMLVDLYPYGVALNGKGHTQPSEKVGFNSDGYLLLSGDDHTSYSYYLKDGKIYNSSNTLVEGYDVDEYFNISGPDGIHTNLFCADSPYKVVRTGYLYLTSSKDGGATWSEPTLLNVKTSSERVCLIAPGSSITTSNGTMIFPVYSYHGDNDPSGNAQRLSFIYSKDGVNWSRTSEFNHNWASEAAVVELNNGTLRFFFRNGSKKLCYVDYDMESGWGSAVTLEDIATNSNTQISAITYSLTSDGKQVILVSCPTGSNRAGSDSSSASNRLNGSIFVFTVDTNGAMNLENTIMVNENNSQFMYSCMTERKDGSVLILYEDQEHGWGVGDNCYYTMDIKGYTSSALGISLDDPQNIIVDANGIVTVAGSIPEGVTVSANTVAEDNVGKYEIKGEVVAALDIKLLGPDGNEVQPNAPVTVTLDASTWDLEDGSVVYIHHDHDGNVSVMSNYLILNGKLTFTVSDFSIFIVESVEDTTGTLVNADDTVEIYAGGDTMIFYWTNDDTTNNNDRRQCVWHVNDPEGAISYEVHETAAAYGDQYLHHAPYIVVTPIKANSVNGNVTLTMDYVYVTTSGNWWNQQENENLTSVKFEIHVNAANDFYVKDEVAESGRLVPAWPASSPEPEGVTYKWTRSDGQPIRSEALNANDGSVNIALDCGGATNNGTITYTVTAYDAAGVEVGEARYEVLYGREILNPSFETPNIKTTPIVSQNQVDCNATFFNGYPGLYWKTTAPSTEQGTLTKDIEIITALGKQSNGQMDYGFISPAADGNQYAELNAEQFGTLYQDMLTTPGAQFTWNFSHAARTMNNSQNTIYIVLAATEYAQEIVSYGQIDAILDRVRNENIPQGGEGYLYKDGENEYRIWRHTAYENDNPKWTKLSGTYTVPDGQYLTRLFFASETDGNSAGSTLGNLIDAVSAGQQMTYKIEYYFDGELSSSLTQQGSASVYDYVKLQNLPEGYVITQALVNGKDYQDNINDGLYITEYEGNSGDENFEIVLKIYLKRQAITVNKHLVIDGWNELSATKQNELQAAIANGYKVNFDLRHDDDVVATAEGSITQLDSSGTASVIIEFAKTPEGDTFKPALNTPYTIVETSAPEISGFTCTTSYSANTITLTNDSPNAAVTVTNKYTNGSADLTIKKEGWQTVDPNQTFLFHVTGNDVDLFVTIHGNGSVTVKDLPIGNYTVTEKTDWSWRYAPDSVEKEVAVKAGADNAVTFTNTRSEKDDNPDTPDNWKWLDGNAWADNLFTGE